MYLKLEVEPTFSMTSQFQLSHMQQLPINRSKGEAESVLNITVCKSFPDHQGFWDKGAFSVKDDPNRSMRGYTGLNSLSPLALICAA